ncbi:SLIT-ROBO Rho GTPase-activating protein 3-like [Micropterus dolomieu]|uniref:SLIT-ROBO Rho GTPase-activating protein 3-like n=1 Tax=Micropterus dolomieu TaxID=147949 RepID=UPI001E8D891D|nr:SLIT-ROBO Rho GTPase-activating protein 3-like [Micropterus dolomieu]
MTAILFSSFLQLNLHSRIYEKNQGTFFLMTWAYTSYAPHHPRKDQHLLSSVNCWYLLLNQTRRESRDHATLSDIYTNNVIVRLAQISEDVIRLFKKSKDIGIQMHEELVKVTNELYTVSNTLEIGPSHPISSLSSLWLLRV